MKMIILLAFGILIHQSVSIKFWDEHISKERLERRVDIFNQWYKNLNPETKVHAKITEDLKVGLYANEDLKFGEQYLQLDRKFLISSELIYNTKIGSLIKSLEEMYGYNDYANIVFYLMNELANPESEWKPYLDILPRQIKTPAFKYWEKKAWLEEELLNIPILKKIVDYKFLVEKKARSYLNILKNQGAEINADVWNEENLEWAIMIIDSRIKYIDYEAFLVPMYDIADFRESKHDSSKVTKLKFSENTNHTIVIAIDDFKKDQEIFENVGLNSDYYLLYQGVVVEPNSNDCYSITLSFSERKDDELKYKRRDFFSKYFLYDSNESDEIEECVSLKDPFSRRMMFYYYTLLMDESDLEKEDPRRIGLESDRIVVDYIKNSMKSLLDMYPTRIDNDQERLIKETNPEKSTILKYLISQKNYLIKLIEFYDNHLHRLIKEDSL